MSATVPLSDAKAHLSELADRVEKEHDRILVTRNGRPSFVLISADDLESLEETLDVLRDRKLVESVRRSQQEAAERKATSSSRSRLTAAPVHDVEITPEGLRHLNRLPEKVRAAAIELVLGGLATTPRQVGKPLVGELAGLWSARRGDYRVVYEIDDDAHVVIVHRVQHRRDVCRSR